MVTKVAGWVVDQLRSRIQSGKPSQTEIGQEFQGAAKFTVVMGLTFQPSADGRFAGPSGGQTQMPAVRSVSSVTNRSALGELLICSNSAGSMAGLHTSNRSRSRTAVGLAAKVGLAKA